MSPESSRIVITGASSGIGAEIAKQLAPRRTNLVLVARRKDRLQRVADQCRELGANAVTVEADVGEPQDCQRLITESVEHLGGLDVLLLNAGISHRGFVESWDSPDVAESLMNVNYHGVVRCAFHALPHLRKTQGLIAVISSLQGKAGFPGNAAYSGSKHALHGFFDSLRSELVGHGVGVSIICPGHVDTEFSARPENAPNVMPASECAERIIAAIDGRKREEIMTISGKLANYLKPFFPGLIDSYIRKRLDEFYDPS